MTKSSTKALNPVMACCAVATVAFLLAFVIPRVSGARLGWLTPLGLLGLLAGGVLALAVPSARKLLDRNAKLGFAFCVFVGLVGLIRWVA